MKYMLRELFFFHSGSGALTERAIYENQPSSTDDKVLVMSGATDDCNSLPACSTAFIEHAKAPLLFGANILVARKGQAGTMRLICENKYTINDNAYVISPKEGASKIISLQFFILAFQELFFDLVTSKDGNGTFAKSIAEKLIVSLPPIDTQLQIVNAYRKQEGVQHKLQAVLRRVRETMRQSVEVNHEKDFLVKDLFKVTSGVRITHKEVYEKTGDFPVVTAKTENNGIAWHASEEWLSTITKNGSKTLVSEDCITWCKNGNAGKLFLRKEPFYPGDDCGVLKPSKPISLEWFFWAAQQAVYANTTSKGGQGKLFDQQMSNISISVPVSKATDDIDISAQQEVVHEYKRLQSIESKIVQLLDKTESATKRLRQMATCSLGAHEQR